MYYVYGRKQSEKKSVKEETSYGLFVPTGVVVQECLTTYWGMECSEGLSFTQITLKSLTASWELNILKYLLMKYFTFSTLRSGRLT